MGNPAVHVTAGVALRSYQYVRYWYLHELLRIRVQKELGSVSVLNADKARKVIQQDMVKLRACGFGTGRH